MARSLLPPGFRFHPTDVELVMYYLKRKILGKKFSFEAISELNIYKFFPWDLPDKSSSRSKDLEWYFFCPRERKYASGARENRATENGYWKSTGKDRSVFYSERNVGMVKTLVFHEGHAPNGKRTNWVIHEYRIDDSNLADAGVTQADYVLCKVFHKSGLGPKNGAQYGAPFKEEDWDGDNDVDIISEFLGVLAPQNNENNSIVTSMMPLERAYVGTSSENPSTTIQDLDELPPPISDGGDVASLLAMFFEDSELHPTEKFDFPIQEICNLHATCLDGNYAYNGLGHLCDLGELNGSGFSFTQNHEAHCELSHLCVSGDAPFLELSDLEIPLSYSMECNGSEGRLIDVLNTPYNCYDPEQFSCGATVQEIPHIHQQPDQITMLQKEADERQNMKQGNDSNSCNVDWTPISQLEGSSHDLQYGEEGGQEKLSLKFKQPWMCIPYCRESVAAVVVAHPCLISYRLLLHPCQRCGDLQGCDGCIENASSVELLDSTCEHSFGQIKKLATGHIWFSVDIYLTKIYGYSCLHCLLNSTGLCGIFILLLFMSC